jgi:hypothetical protein
MKLMMLLCGGALLVAGCNTPRNPYGYYGEYSFNYDLTPQPLPGITPTELDQIQQAQITGAPPSLFRQWSAEHNDSR